jgi:transketolase
MKDSIMEGHPVPIVPFVDVATGSLGQGLSVASGMAYSSKYFDKIDNRIFCITGDGEMMEGSNWEAADFAQYYKLNNLTLFMDVNGLGQSQATMYEHETDNFVKKFTGFGWAPQVVDGHSVRELIFAIDKARKETSRPTAIICKTFKGHNFGESIENKLDWHGKDLGDKLKESVDHIKLLIKNENVEFKTHAPKGNDPKKDKGKVTVVPSYEANAKTSTRMAYGVALKKARSSNPNVVGLDGDTKNSTFSCLMEKSGFIECFIAEQNMVGVATGLSCRGKIPFCSTFAAFFERAADQIRIAGISCNPIKLVGSHSGCSIGEDGPSQMALEDLGFFRNIPNSVVLVPSDGVSTECAVELVGNYNEGPTFIRTTRPEVPVLYSNTEPF